MRPLETHTLGGRNLAVAALAVTLLGAAPAPSAAPSREQCFDAYERGQRLRKSSELRQARALLITCADERCPVGIRRDCARWVGEVEAEMPSVVLAAKTADGRDEVMVRVLVDGQLVTEQLDGKPIEIDPGEHRFRFEPRSGVAEEATWVIHQREKGRILTLTFGTRDADAQRGKRRGGSRPVLPWVLGGVGVVGLGMFTYFGLHGRSLQNDLDEKNCKPRCPKDEADAMDRSYLIANISLGVGLVSLGAAGYLFVRGRSEAPKEARVSFGAGLLPGAAMGTVRGRF